MNPAPAVEAVRMPARAARKRPVEYSILYTATLCLLAGGAVMVYSASSAESLLSGPGDPSYYLKRYVMFGAGRAGAAAPRLAARAARSIRALTPLLLMASFVPDGGGDAARRRRDGERRHALARAGPLQFQPSELLKVSLVLYAAQLLAARPQSTRTRRARSRSRCCSWWARPARC